MSDKFTKGQLIVSDRVTGGYSIRCEAKNKKQYYQNIGMATQRDEHPVYGGGVTDEEAQANAKLFAASPQMLEALRSIVASFHESVKTTEALETFPALHDCIQAIDKAVK